MADLRIQVSSDSTLVSLFPLFENLGEHSHSAIEGSHLLSELVAQRLFLLFTLIFEILIYLILVMFYCFFNFFDFSINTFLGPVDGILHPALEVFNSTDVHAITKFDDFIV